MSTAADMKTTRSYTMTARAEAVEATRRAVLDALAALSLERWVTEISLEDVASRAGVSVQTVLRHFGSRAGLVEAGVRHVQAQVEEERRTPVGDVEGALQVICGHYESRGRSVLMMLAQERADEVFARITAEGRAMHRRWVAEVFAPFLPATEADREAAVDLLVVATDVYTWKLLRLDRGLGPRQTRQRMQHLVGMVLAGLGTTSED